MDSAFLGREAELAAAAELLRETSLGRGGALVVHGEPGIGKTALLERVLEKALVTFPVPRPLRASGIGGAGLAFGALHDLCEPLLAGAAAAALPGPRREALETAFVLRDGPPPDRARLGFAVRSLLAEAARERPIVCLVDDAHALDRGSAEILAFAAHRVGTAPVAFLLAGDPSGLLPFGGLPSHRLTGLGHDDALELLTARLRAPMDVRILDRIIAEARGNPRALLAHRREVGVPEAAGGYGLPAPPSSPTRGDDLYRRHVAPLPADTRRLLLVAAAEPLGDPALLWDAARRLGLGTVAAAPAEAAGLLDLGALVRFAHPGLRPSIYRAATPEERRDAHRALAEATDPLRDPDRRAWHRAQAAVVPDESVAAALERNEPRARTRAGLSAAGAFLERAAALTPDPARRAARALAAARCHLRAGAAETATRSLATAAAGPLDATGRARARLLTAHLSTRNGRRADAVAPLLDAAAELAAHDLPAAREACLDALAAALAAGRFGDRPLARAARAGAAHGRGDRPMDLLLDALSVQVTEGDVAASSALRAAVDAFLAMPEGHEPDDLKNWLASGAAADLWDEGAWRALAERQLRAARRTGVATVVPLALRQLAFASIHAGGFCEAAHLIAEARAAADAAGSASRFSRAELLLAAWRGDAERLERLGETGARVARDHGRGHLLSVIDYATAVLNNGAGHYEIALRAARRAARHDDPGLHSVVPCELVEAAVRADRPHVAESILERIEARTRAAGTDWARGIALRSRALVTGVEDLYREAIHHLARTGAVPQLARTHLLYGEWLRREHRRADAREHLRTAHDTLTSIGADGFAARAARELAACGDRPHKVGKTPLERLTPQETLVARLVADGATSKEAAGELFVSPRTVEAHLRSIFRKLGLTSRRQLRDLRPQLAAPRPDDPPTPPAPPPAGPLPGPPAGPSPGPPAGPGRSPGGRLVDPKHGRGVAGRPVSRPRPGP